MRLTCGHQHATPPSPGRQSGQCTNAPTIGGNKIEVKLTAKLEKGSGSAALGKQANGEPFGSHSVTLLVPFLHYLKLIFIGV